MHRDETSMGPGSRRNGILDAAIELLAERGLAGLTHRATDEAAGLPAGSSSYYYPKKVALIAGVAERLAERLETDSEDLRLRFADMMAEGRRDDALALVSEALCACAEKDRALLLARTEISLAAFRDAALRPARDRLTAASQSPLAFYLKILAGQPTDQAVRACSGVIDGLLLAYATGQAPAPTPSEITALCKAMLP